MIPKLILIKSCHCKQQELNAFLERDQCDDELEHWKKSDKWSEKCTLVGSFTYSLEFNLHENICIFQYWSIWFLARQEERRFFFLRTIRRLQTKKYSIEHHQNKIFKPILRMWNRKAATSILWKWNHYHLLSLAKCYLILNLIQFLNVGTYWK